MSNSIIDLHDVYYSLKKNEEVEVHFDGNDWIFKIVKKYHNSRCKCGKFKKSEFVKCTTCHNRFLKLSKLGIVEE